MFCGTFGGDASRKLAMCGWSWRFGTKDPGQSQGGVEATHTGRRSEGGLGSC
jgi:hypothetical protein